MNICKSDVYFIIVILLIIFVYYKLNAKINIKEHFEVTEDLKNAVKQVYNADVDAIRNLSDIATKLQAGGLTVAGDMFVKGRIYCKGGDAGGGGDTHFPYTNGENFIRGHTNHDGDFRANRSLTVAGNAKVNGNLEVGGKLILPNNTQLSADGDNATQWLRLQQTSNPGQHKSLALQDLWCGQGHIYANNISCNEIKVGNITIRDNNLRIGPYRFFVENGGSIAHHVGLQNRLRILHDSDNGLSLANNGALHDFVAWGSRHVDIVK